MRNRDILGNVRGLTQWRHACTLQVKASPIAASVFYVFIAPPSMEDLEARLRGRGTEDEEKIQLRLSGAATEMAKAEVSGTLGALGAATSALPPACNCLLRLLHALFRNITGRPSVKAACSFLG